MEQGSGLGLVVAMYSPAEVDYTLANGIQAKLSIKTDYPFDGTVTIDASCEKGMILSLRIPSWAYKSNISVNGTKGEKYPFPGGYNKVIILLNLIILHQVPFMMCFAHGQVRLCSNYQ